MYEQHFGLTRRPFENTPNPEFFFASRQHREALAALSYGIEACKGFMLLTGDVGAGKTFVLQSLKHELKDKDPIYLEVSTPWITAEELFAELPRRLGMNVDAQWGSIEFQDELKAKLIEVFEQGRRVIVLLDEAQQLPERTLEGVRLLSNYETQNAKLIQIVFVGQNELHETLAKYSLRQVQQRITLSRTLHYLSELETRRYIRHRLLVSGRSDSVFTEASLTLIYRSALGSPRLINLICDNCLITGFAQQAKEITPDIVRDVVDDLPIANALPQVRPKEVVSEKRENIESESESRPASVVAVNTVNAVNSVPVKDEVAETVQKKVVVERVHKPANVQQSGVKADSLSAKHSYFDDERVTGDTSMGSIGSDSAERRRLGRGQGISWFWLLLLLPVLWIGARWYENQQKDSEVAQEEIEQQSNSSQTYTDLNTPVLLEADNEQIVTSEPGSLFDQIRQEVDATIIRDVDSHTEDPVADGQRDTALTSDAAIAELDLDRLDTELAKPSEPTAQLPQQSIQAISVSTTSLLEAPEQRSNSDQPALPGVFITTSSGRSLVSPLKVPESALSGLGGFVAPSLPIDDLRSAAERRTVRSGENLSQIARQTYGTWNDTVQDIVWEVNPHISHRMHLLLKGDRVNLPMLSQQDVIIELSGQSYIYAGTLTSGVKALGLKRALEQQGVQSDVAVLERDDDKLYRLFIGPYESDSDAMNALAGLEFRHMPFLIK